jgi:TPR repeat protein
MFHANALPIVAGVLSLMSMSSGYGQNASPVRCRDALRPVLLQASPDRVALPGILSLCEGQAEAGDPDALYQLSLLYLGLIDWQPDKAIPMIRSAADSGVSEAQYWLAWQYESGPLLENDPELALQWYLRAGEQDHRLALNRLADVFEQGGLGMPADMRQARLYRARAARCEN